MRRGSAESEQLLSSSLARWDSTLYLRRCRNAIGGCPAGSSCGAAAPRQDRRGVLQTVGEEGRLDLLQKYTRAARAFLVASVTRRGLARGSRKIWCRRGDSNPHGFPTTPQDGLARLRAPGKVVPKGGLQPPRDNLPPPKDE